MARIRAEGATRYGITDASEGIVNMARKADIKATDKIVKDVGLSKGQRRLLQNEITKQGFSIEEILETAKEIKIQFPKK